MLQYKRGKESSLHSILVIFQWSTCRLSYQKIQYFTFHSGYIPIKHACKCLRTFQPLHSILVIFQSNMLLTVRMFEAFTFHSGYIPIAYKEKFASIQGIFTFHSGYIPIYLITDILFHIGTLHSILVIFQ